MAKLWTQLSIDSRPKDFSEKLQCECKCSDFTVEIEPDHSRAMKCVDPNQLFIPPYAGIITTICNNCKKELSVWPLNHQAGYTEHGDGSDKKMELFFNVSKLKTKRKWKCPDCKCDKHEINADLNVLEESKEEGVQSDWVLNIGIKCSQCNKENNKWIRYYNSHNALSTIPLAKPKPQKALLPIPTHLKEIFKPEGDSNSEFHVHGHLKCKCNCDKFRILLFACTDKGYPESYEYEFASAFIVKAICANCLHEYVVYDYLLHGFEGFVFHEGATLAKNQADKFKPWICKENKCGDVFSVKLTIYSNGVDDFLEETEEEIEDGKKLFRKADWVNAFSRIVIGLECATCNHPDENWVDSKEIIRNGEADNSIRVWTWEEVKSSKYFLEANK